MVAVAFGEGRLPRFSRRSQSCFGEVGSPWREPSPPKWLPAPSWYPRLRRRLNRLRRPEAISTASRWT